MYIDNYSRRKNYSTLIYYRLTEKKTEGEISSLLLSLSLSLSLSLIVTWYAILFL